MWSSSCSRRFKDRWWIRGGPSLLPLDGRSLCWRAVVLRRHPHFWRVSAFQSSTHTLLKGGCWLQPTVPMGPPPWESCWERTTWGRTLRRAGLRWPESGFLEILCPGCHHRLLHPPWLEPIQPAQRPCPRPLALCIELHRYVLHPIQIFDNSPENIRPVCLPGHSEAGTAWDGEEAVASGSDCLSYIYSRSLGARWALTSTSRPEGLQKKKTPVMADLKYLNYKIINSNCLLFKVTNMQMGQTYWFLHIHLSNSEVGSLLSFHTQPITNMHLFKGKSMATPVGAFIFHLKLDNLNNVLSE